MIDLILLTFSVGMYVGGWYTHKHFGSFDAMKTWVKGLAK